MPANGPGPARIRILVVARGDTLRDHIARVLKGADYEVDQAEGIAHARRIGLKDFALIVVVPDGLGPDGHVFVADAKAMMRTLLVASSSDASRAASELLDPTDADALLAGAAAALRPVEDAELALALRFAQYCLSPAAHTLIDETGAEIRLTPGEFRLLRGFVERPGRVLSRDQLLRAVSGSDVEAYDRSVDMLVSRLRRKIEPDPKHPKMIITIPGSGYKFAARVQKTEIIASSSLGNSTAPFRAAQTGCRPPASPQRDQPFYGKPYLMVAPFPDFGGDPEQEHFSHSLVDDVIIELSRSPSPFIIAHGRKATAEVAARYTLKGNVHRAERRVRINAQLIDAEAGALIWAECYNRTVEDAFSVQDEIAASVAIAIIQIVTEAERRRAVGRPPEKLSAWEAYQRGLWHMAKNDPVENDRAKDFFQRAIALNATFVAPYSALALACLFDGSQFATRPLEEAIGVAVARADEAVATDPSDADAQAVLATATLWTGDREAAWERAVQAFSGNRNSPWALGMMAGIPLNNGQPAVARDLLLRALRRSPRDPHSARFLRYLAMSYYFEYDYVRAAEAAKRALAIHTRDPMLWRWCAASLGQLGRADEARSALRKAVGVTPGCFDVYVRNRPLWSRPDDHELMLDGLRRAGWRG